LLALVGFWLWSLKRSRGGARVGPGTWPCAGSDRGQEEIEEPAGQVLVVVAEVAAEEYEGPPVALFVPTPIEKAGGGGAAASSHGFCTFLSLLA